MFLRTDTSFGEAVRNVKCPELLAAGNKKGTVHKSIGRDVFIRMPQLFSILDLHNKVARSNNNDDDNNKKLWGCVFGVSEYQGCST